MLTSKEDGVSVPRVVQQSYYDFFRFANVSLPPSSFVAQRMVVVVQFGIGWRLEAWRATGAVLPEGDSGERAGGKDAMRILCGRARQATPDFGHGCKMVYERGEGKSVKVHGAESVGGRSDRGRRFSPTHDTATKLRKDAAESRV